MIVNYKYADCVLGRHMTVLGSTLKICADTQPKCRQFRMFARRITRGSSTDTR